MRARTIASMIAIAGIAWLYRPTPVHACGGCFSPQETITTVDSHRMVISLTIERTVLWDQIRYSGSPEDFVWVLPVPTADAQLELADPIFFDDLERTTAPQIFPPALPPGPDCPPPPDGFGGGQDAAPSAPDAGGVDVYREETVGPYETAVIGSDDPNALYNWLIDHDYNVPPETVPIMSYYVDLKSKFIVMRLAPEQDVQAMQPVRVVYPGYMATFPLKMVKVGAYGTLDLTLWVIADQRYDASNYGTVTIDERDLIWDFARNTSNYTALFRAAIDNGGGKAWVAEYAQPTSAVWFEAWEEAEFAQRGIKYPYLTRLRTSMLIDHIADDLLLAPAADPTAISSTLNAPNGINQPPPLECPDWDGDGEPDSWSDASDDQLIGCGCVATNAGGGAATLGLALLVALGLRRRRVWPLR